MKCGGTILEDQIVVVRGQLLGALAVEGVDERSLDPVLFRDLGRKAAQGHMGEVEQPEVEEIVGMALPETPEQLSRSNRVLPAGMVDPQG